MAPPSGAGRRVKGCQIQRPFIYGTTARPFGEKNPKPPGIPDDHTHSWEVFVKGIDDTDITYWLRRVQFKLHESIPNHLRSTYYIRLLLPPEPSKQANQRPFSPPTTVIDGKPGEPFVVRETGWGEFEITLKLYYVSESGEKPQTLYHHLHLHPYGRTEADKEAMRATGEVVAWIYEEQLFNEPYEAFYDILTSGALPDPARPAGAKGKGKGKGAKAGAVPPGQRSEGGVLPRSAMIPRTTRPNHPFSQETEQLEIKKLRAAYEQASELMDKMREEQKVKDKRLADLKRETAANP